MRCLRDGCIHWSTGIDEWEAKVSDLGVGEDNGRCDEEDEDDEDMHDLSHESRLSCSYTGDQL